MGRIGNLKMNYGTKGNPQIEISNYTIKSLMQNGKEKNSNSIEQNVYKASKYYDFNEESGYFGRKGNSQKVRVIYSNNPIVDASILFNILKSGGNVTSLPNKKGIKAVLKDYTVITFRRITKTKDSPAIDINIEGSKVVKNQKIHFVIKGGRK